MSELTFNAPFTVRMHEVGPSGKAPVHALLRYFQEAAGLHAEALGWGIEPLMEHDLAWVLARLTIKMERAPGPCEPLTVTTWPVDSSKYTARRDFEILDATGGSICCGASNWVMMDVNARRMMSIPQQFRAMFDLDTPAPITEFNGKKVPALQESVHETDILVRLEDLDLNGHANNTHIAAWMLEPVSDEIQSAYLLASLDIQFRSEVRAGERLRSLCEPEAISPEAASLRHSLIHSDGTEVARCRSTWRTV